MAKSRKQVGLFCKNGKVSYRSKSLAKSRAKHYLSKYGTVGRVYRCPICDYYHLTKSPQK